MKAIIRSLGSYAPSRVMTNEELSGLVDTSDEWIYSHTGIKRRHIADESEAASDLGFKAAQRALEASQNDGEPEIKADDIDLILCATSTPDFPGFPSTACIIQDLLQAKNAAAMDVTAACTGFIYALETAKNFIVSGSARQVLVVGTEIFSRIINWKDRSTCVLFGDGAGAALLSASERDDPAFIGKSCLYSQGSGATFLSRPSGGSRIRKQEENSEADQYVQMNGRQVYVFAVQAIIDSINLTLEKNHLNFEDIDYVVPHQANRRIIEAACKRANWDEAKFHLNMEEYANTSAASIPLALDELYLAGKLKPGTTVITVGFGGGLTYGSNLLRF